MSKMTVYVETSVVSYLTARPSRDLVAAANQKTTIDWWDSQRSRFDLYISDIVLEEARRGDPTAAKNRIAALADIPVLAFNDDVVGLSNGLIARGALTKKALDDSLHIAVSAVHGVDFLLTWNCRHIDNAETKPLIRDVCATKGHRCPEICTPQELMGVLEHD